jgi:hypothetical protein
LRIFHKRWDPHYEEKEYGEFIDHFITLLPKEEKAPQEPMEDQAFEKHIDEAHPIKDQVNEEKIDEEPYPFEKQMPTHEFNEDQRLEEEASTSLPVEDQTCEESLHEENVVQEESIHSSSWEDKVMVSCNPFQISEFYHTWSCDLEKEDVEETSFDEERVIDALFLIESIDGIRIVFILMDIQSMIWMMMFLKPIL